MNWNWKAEIRGDYGPWNYVQLHARPKPELLKPQRGVCNWPRLNTTQMHSNQCREEVTEHLLSRTETCNEITQLLSSPAVCSSSVSRRLVIVASDSCSTTRKAIHSSKRQRGKSPPCCRRDASSPQQRLISNQRQGVLPAVLPESLGNIQSSKV